jgi:hypothetical protein
MLLYIIVFLILSMSYGNCPFESIYIGIAVHLTGNSGESLVLRGRLGIFLFVMLNARSWVFCFSNKIELLVCPVFETIC